MLSYNPFLYSRSCVNGESEIIKFLYMLVSYKDIRLAIYNNKKTTLAIIGKR